MLHSTYPAKRGSFYHPELGPLEDRFKRPENRVQNAHRISRDCDVTGRNVLSKTLKRTLVDHGC